MENGNDIIKTLKPFGCALVIICFVAFLGICFTSGGDHELPGYTAPAVADAAELLCELEANVLPQLEGVTACYEQDGKVIL